MLKKSVFVILFLAFALTGFLWAEPKTEVMVLGTIGNYHFENKNYDPALLIGILDKFKPQVAALEITPAFIDKPDRIASPEMYLILPYCREHNVKAYGMDWLPYDPYSFSRDMPIEKETFSKEAVKYPAVKARLEEYEKSQLAKEYNDVLPKDLSVKDIFFFNSPDMKDFMKKLHDAQYKVMDDSPFNEYWERRNLEMSRLCLKTIKANPGKRIVICTNYEHVYWIENFLKKYDYVKLVSPEDLKPVKPVKKMPARVQDFIDWYYANNLLCAVNTNESNLSPNTVDLSGIEKDIKKLEKKKNLNCVAEYTMGMYYYITRNYLKSVDYFKKASVNKKGDEITTSKGVMSLTKFAQLKTANLYDLLKKRDQALVIYNEVLKAKDTPSWMKNQCKNFINKPFARPVS